MLQPASQTACVFPAEVAVQAHYLRGARQKSKINLRAFNTPEQALKRKRPKLCRKNKGGAPKGNRNARKHGLYSEEMRELRLTVRRAIAQLNMAAALVHAEAARMDAEILSRLADAGLSRRALWLSEN